MNRILGEELLPVARNTIKKHLGLDTEEITLEGSYREKGACFVTLTINGELRGCIGSIVPYRPLLEDIEENALAAAFQDPRFFPLKKEEVRSLIIEISVLSPLEEIPFDSEEDILEAVTPQVHGMLLAAGGYRGVFLPQVWEHYPEKEDFFRHLKMKAGLDPDFYDPLMTVYKYTVDAWRETS